MQRTLADLAPPQAGTIARLDGGDGLTQRLYELGFTPGESVQLVRVAPLGDPLQVRIRGFDVALRRKEAGRIVLEAPAAE